MSVMTSYNQIDGEWAGQSSYVIKKILREKLGFKWLVMSDWNSVWDLEKVIKSGQNLEMPGSYNFGVSVLDLYHEKKITEKDLDDMIRPTLATCVAMGFYSRPKYDTTLLVNILNMSRLRGELQKKVWYYLKTGMKFYRLILQKIEKYY